MLKYLLLITPIYVTLFWTIILSTYHRQQSIARMFLGKFMAAATVIYISHFLFYYPYPNLYFFIDPFYQYAIMLVFPLYNIYIRLLTVDEKFTFRHHTRYIFIPTLLFLLYLVGTLYTPIADYKTWIYNRDFSTSTPGIHFLKDIHTLIRITFLVQVIVTTYRSYELLIKHGDKAKQFYADLQDSSTYKVSILNLAMIITGATTIMLGVLGQHFFKNELTSIAIASITFSTMLFIIGWLGHQQKKLSPSTGLAVVIKNEPIENELTTTAQQEIVGKIHQLFDEKKFYLHHKANIIDLAQAVGTNRTYLSNVINQHFNMSFCCFVNNYRLEELEKVFKNHPEFNAQQLAEASGFGSIDSLKRAIKSKYSLTIPAWKKANASNAAMSTKNPC